MNPPVGYIALSTRRGTVGRAAVGSQSGVPPAPSLSSEWWENVASGHTLIPGADISDTEVG